MPADSNTQITEVGEDLARQVRERIESIKTRPLNPIFKHEKGSYLFDVEGVGAWKVALDQGKKTVTEGATEADCIIHSDADLFLKVAGGEQNLLTAFMQGRLEIEGDMALAQKLNSILPGPKQDAGGQGGGV